MYERKTHKAILRSLSHVIFDNIKPLNVCKKRQIRALNSEFIEPKVLD